MIHSKNFMNLTPGDGLVMLYATSGIFVNTGLGEGFSPVWCQAITWTNDNLLLKRTLKIFFSEIWIIIENFPFKKMYLQMLSAKFHPFCF